MHFTTYMGLAELIEAYRQREVSPTEAVQAALDRIEEINPRINAYYHIDALAALKAARSSEQRWKQGEPLGMLDGVPTTTKDALATAGMKGGRGSAAEAEVTPDRDCPSVARMRQAGAVILGKNTMSDYGILAAGVSSRYGPTRNPWNLGRTPGASSSGAAASVACGVEPVSIGTDIVGSIRLPASYCGLAGLKPSQGRVPFYFPTSPSVVAGPLARSVRDLALHLNVLAQPDADDFTALPYDGRDYAHDLGDLDPSKLRILVITDLGMGQEVAAEVAAALRSAADTLNTVGARIEVLDTKPFEESAFKCAEAFYKVRCLTELSKRPDEEARRSHVIWKWTRDAVDGSAIDFYRSHTDVQLLRERAVRLISGFDFILMPTTPQTAFDAELPAPDPGNLFEPWAYTFLFNLTEQPAASIPYGQDGDGLPIGLQIVGNRFDDLGVLRLGALLETTAPVLDQPGGLHT